MTTLDLMLATLKREAMHARIVRKFGGSLRDHGAGPSDDDLRCFARLAIVESRLARRLGRAVKSDRCLVGVQVEEAPR